MSGGAKQESKVRNQFASQEPLTSDVLKHRGAKQANFAGKLIRCIIAIRYPVSVAGSKIAKAQERVMDFDLRKE
jgi:hypothetical protein